MVSLPRLPQRAETLLLSTLLSLPPVLLRRLAGRPVVLDGQTLAAESQLLLRLKELAGVPPIEEVDLAAARRETRHQAALVSGGQPIGAVRDLTVPGAGGPLPARLYTPTARVGETAHPTLLYFHGGGFAYGDLESHDGAVRHLAEHSGVQVLSVEYRKAPEHPFPAGHDDCVAAYRWLVEHPEEVGADAARLAVGGDSAGGNLAAAVALAAAREGLPLAFQLLVYPTTSFGERTRSRELFEQGFFLTREFMDQVDEWYLTPVTLRDPRASVIEAEVPGGLAAALVVTAGFDPLRDEGRAYARKLAGAGVAVEHVEHSDTIHSFWNVVSVGRVIPSYNREIAQKVGAALIGTSSRETPGTESARR